MKIISTIAEYYVANGTVLWSSMTYYLELAILPIAILVALQLIKELSHLSNYRNQKLDTLNKSIFGLTSDIAWGLILISWVKFLIAICCCFVNFIYRLF